MNFRGAAAMLLCIFGFFQGHALGSPVAYTPAGGTMGLYCYDFQNYIPSSSSPVIGGWQTFGLTFIPFGKVCVNGPYNGVVDPYTVYAGSRSVAGFVQDSRAPGLYFGFDTGVDNSGMFSYYYALRIRMPSCPANSAAIPAPGYVRSDGGITPPIGYWSIYTFGMYAGSIASYPNSPPRSYAVVPSYPNGVDTNSGLTNPVVVGLYSVSGGCGASSTDRSTIVCVKTDTAP